MGLIVVTGAAGFIGSHTVEQLLRAGHRVIGIDNFRTGSAENLREAHASADFLFVRADVAEVGAMDRILRGRAADALIHLAALVSVQESLLDPALNRRLNVDAVKLTGEAAARGGVRRIVFASSAAVYGDPAVSPIAEAAEKRPLSPYGEAKRESEQILAALAAREGIVVRSLRYFNVYGPRQPAASPYSGVISVFARAWREQREIVIDGDGRQTRDFISVRDVARANLAAATLVGGAEGAFNVCTGRGTTIARLAEILNACGAGLAGVRQGAARAGDIRISVGDGSLAAGSLGFHPEVGLEDGLAELLRAE